MADLSHTCRVMLLAAANSAWAAEGAQITVKVLDKSRDPVVGTVVLNPGNVRLGKTRKDGVYSFRHDCEAGQRLKAEPDDGGRYYDSAEQRCDRLVVLEVFPRPQASYGQSDAFKITLVKSPMDAASVQTYAGVFGMVVDKTETMGGASTKCKLTIQKKVNVAYYNAKMGDWKTLDDALPEAPAVGNPQTTYYFASPCEESLQRIVAIKGEANQELKVGVADYLAAHSKAIDKAILDKTP
jgi:hypothetical protein